MAVVVHEPAEPSRKKPLYTLLYVQVLIGIAFGILVGCLFPGFATHRGMEALGTGFINLIKMVIGPIIFCTVVSGIAGVENAKKVGKVGGKTILYFEVVSTFALIIGLVIGNLVQPGANFAGSHGDVASIKPYADAAGHEDIVKFFLKLIPDTIFSAFIDSKNILQVLLVSVLFGFALMFLGERARPLRELIDRFAHAIFGVLAIIMRAAPIGAFGAMAFIVGTYGPQSLGNLLFLILTFYATAALFVVVVLGTIARFVGFNIFSFLNYIKNELLIVLGTSSSESALPLLMEKLERLGCSKSVVGLVVPTGYSFNLDGTNIYMTLATLFIAQALHVDLSLGQQLTILGVAMITSKGASGVTGAGFITLAATLGSVNPALVPGMAIIFGIDKFMSECRAITNIIGNGVATIVISWSEGELDRERLKAALAAGAPDPGDVRAAVIA